MQSNDQQFSGSVANGAHTSGNTRVGFLAAMDPASAVGIQLASSPGAAPVSKRRLKTLLLGVKFDRDPQHLGYGPEIATEDGKLWCVTMALEEAAAWWIIILYNYDAPELRNQTIHGSTLQAIRGTPG